MSETKKTEKNVVAIITMFFIGASLSVDVIKSVGIRPLLQGILLWIIISAASLAYILLK